MIELKTGMFGVLDNGQQFVVVGDKLVYRDGGWDWSETYKSGRNMYHKVLRLYNNVCSFDGLVAYEEDEERCAIYDVEEEPVTLTFEEVKSKLGVKNLIITM